MKKSLCALAALMFCSFLSAKEHKLPSRNIQYENRNELSFSYGALATSQYLNGISEMSDYHVLLSDYSYGDDNYIGPVSLEYFRRMNRWLGLGGITVFTHNKQTIVRNHRMVGTAYDNYFTLLPSVKCDWLRRQYYGLYSKLGLGVTMRAEKQKSDGLATQNTLDAFFNFQFTLLGFEGGSSRLRAFVEVGMGEQGTALVGLRYKF
jgi:hypothetical protein